MPRYQDFCTSVFFLEKDLNDGSADCFHSIAFLLDFGVLCYFNSGSSSSQNRIALVRNEPGTLVLGSNTHHGG